MTDIKSQDRYESYSDRQLAELIVNGVQNSPEVQLLRQLLINRRRKHYRLLIDFQHPPQSKSPKSEKSVSAQPESPKPERPVLFKSNPPAQPKPDPKPDNDESAGFGCYAIIVVGIAFWSVPQYGWLIGLLIALGWPLILVFLILNYIFSKY